MISIIAAISKNSRALGKGNDLIWKIPDDLKRFKALTTGHPIIMGRKTYESIGRLLPNRTNIIVTRNGDYKAEGCVVVTSIEDAIRAARQRPGGSEEIFLIGGGDLYKQALPLVDRLYMTLIDAEAPADIFFPPYETEFTKVIERDPKQFGDLKYEWVTLER